MPRSLGWYLPQQLVLKIILAGSQPPIWRRVEVHSGLTLYELHYVIQCVFDWDDSHLWHFLAPPGGQLARRAVTNAVRYHVLPPDPVFGGELEEAGDRRADEAITGQVLNPECKQIIYEYDFGDSWEHVVKVEKRTAGGRQRTRWHYRPSRRSCPAWYRSRRRGRSHTGNSPTGESASQIGPRRARS